MFFLDFIIKSCLVSFYWLLLPSSIYANYAFQYGHRSTHTLDEKIGEDLYKIVETKSCQLVLQKADQVSLPGREFKGLWFQYQIAPGPLGQGRMCGRRSRIKHETRHVTGLKYLGTLKLTNLGYKCFYG